MSETDLPLILEPEQLDDLLERPDIRVIDLSRPQVHAQYRVPGASHVDYGEIVTSRRPVGGLLPDAAAFADLMSRHGIGPETWVVAYDDEGGGCAARLLYTLQAYGHRRGSLLSGGIHAWANEGHRLDLTPPKAREARFEASYDASVVADADYIMSRLGAADFALLDARSAPEYHGSRAFAAKAGHIPGAVHLEWTDAMDRDHNLRLRPQSELRAMVEARGLSAERETVVYCQTHHRSALSYVMLQSLGFERLRGYPGSWSDWGNRQETPVETG